MPVPQRFLNRRVCSDVFLTRVGQAACFLAAPLVMAASFFGVARFAASPIEVLLAVLGGSSVALLLVILGLLLPLAVARPES